MVTDRKWTWWYVQKTDQDVEVQNGEGVGQVEGDFIRLFLDYSEGMNFSKLPRGLRHSNEYEVNTRPVESLDRRRDL